jgi:hypothetical protein
MRFVTGFYTERMNDLEIQLDKMRSERLAKLETVKQLRVFLEEFGYALESDVAKEIALADLKERIAEQEALKAELLSAKFKLARSESASSVLSGVSFEYCPACGADIKQSNPHQPGICHLCGRYSAKQDQTIVPQAEIVRRDLTARVEDLTESIERHKKALKRQEDVVAQRQREKVVVDERLNAELSTYDSAYLSRAREVEQRIATLQERKRGLEKMARMPEAITKLEEEAGRLREQEEKLKREIDAEKKKLTEAEHRIQEIGQAYLEALLRVGVPGISEKDRIEIGRTTWRPWIIPEQGDAYNFYNAGSGGKKTLLNVCYALAVHKVAAEHGLPLPTFLMIDTPMKNIGEDVNENIFRNFYHYLYDLATGPLSNTQFIIIDKEYFPPEADSELEVVERYMEPEQPLISYYRGP